MTLSIRERYKQIARFQRPGDLYLTDQILPDTLSNWIEQGAPEPILPQTAALYGNQFLRNYFKLDNKQMISEVNAGWAGAKEIEIGQGIVILDGSPLVPGYDTKIIEEDVRKILSAENSIRAKKIPGGTSKKNVLKRIKEISQKKRM